MGNKPSTGISGVAVKEATKLEIFEHDYPVAREALDRNSYVDNTNTGADTHEQLRKNIQEIEYVAGKGGFYYKPWIVSGDKNPDVLIGPTTDISEKNLGVIWLVTKDLLQVRPKVAYGGNSRRGKLVYLQPLLNDIEKAIPLKLRLCDCLSVHAKCYDPLGLVLPVKMNGNLLFRFTLFVLRKDCKFKSIPWDQVIPEKLLKKWLSYFSMLEALKDVTFPRSVQPDLADPEVKPDLIEFGDGNEDAFGALAYLRWTLLDGSKEVRLLMAKAKLAPLTHKGEVVKCELSSATYIARLKVFILRETNLKIGLYRHFIDSQIVQYMIRKDSYSYNTFAGIRVAEIQKKTDVEDWFHIPSEENIADVLTRGTAPDKIGSGSVWQQGPAWLKYSENQWPITELKMGSEDKEIVQKFVSKSKTIDMSTCLQIVSLQSYITYGDWLEQKINKFSDLDSVLRVTVIRMRFTKNIRGLVHGKNQPKENLVQKGSESEPVEVKNMENLPGCRTEIPEEKEEKNEYGKTYNPISSKEKEDAWNVLIALEQEKCRIVIKEKKHLMLKNVEVLLNNGDRVNQIILGNRVKLFPVGFHGRKEVPYLPAGKLAELIVKKFHNKFHVDVDTTVCHIRNVVFIPQLRRIVGKVDRNCTFCKLKRRKFASQEMGDLPDVRTSISPPFQNILLDLFGPFTIKDDCVKKGPRVHKKVWGVLVSCCSTRAVYLDVATNYDTESILHCIRRLQAHRGSVRVITSDPGSQLVGASNELREWRRGWSEEKLIEFGSKHGIEWRFIMANSQHQTGGVEVMVKLAKGAIKAIMHKLGQHKVTLNELNTILAEAANLINSRPIGLKPNKDTDVEYLTPNSLLLGRSSDTISGGPFEAKDMFDQGSKLDHDRFKLTQRIVNQFWEVWIKNYFPTLLVRKKWHQRQRNMKVGDVCLLQDSNQVRGEFRMCRVSRVFPDPKGIVRNVEVLAAHKKDGARSYHPQGLSRLRRHVNNLIVIVPVDDEDKKEVHDSEKQKEF